MASNPSATAKPADHKSAEQARALPHLGGMVHEWQQWLAPGVVVAVVLAMGSLQRADLQEFRAEVQSDIRAINDRLDRVDTRFDRVNDRFDQVNDRIEQGDARINSRIDQMNSRIDQIYRLLLP
ncbi:MAG: hypothetical protein F4Y87_03715 [Synechococcus sp. SB0665_bin_28]|nr:hypothetical protein [Synechococcus sp. SB0665_bin_28]MYF19791.1 hypothetical protein [Synechococcus sp. SB0677_bin_5]